MVSVRAVVHSCVLALLVVGCGGAPPVPPRTPASQPAAAAAAAAPAAATAACAVGARRFGPWPASQPAASELEQGCVVDGERGKRRVGSWTLTTPDGVVLARLTYREGKLHGPRVTLRPDGRPAVEEHYDAGARHGTYRAFYPDGTVQVEGAYAKGKRVGRWIWRTAVGALERQVEFERGFAAIRWQCPAGTTLTKNETGREERAWFCARPGGVKHGPFTSWYADGGTRDEAEYRDGKRHGRWRTFDQRGLTIDDCVFVDDRRHGFCAWREYRGRAQGAFERGEPIGRHVRWRGDDLWEVVVFQPAGVRQRTESGCRRLFEGVQRALTSLGWDLRNAPAAQRRSALARLLANSGKELSRRSPPGVDLAALITGAAAGDGAEARFTGRPGTRLAGDAWVIRGARVEHVSKSCVELKP